MFDEKNIRNVNVGNGITLSGMAGDYILQYIEHTNGFYEQDMLEKWVKPLGNKVKVIYDIGANIGNHTVYFATNTKAEKIYSFEPVKLNYEILLQNIEANSLQTIIPMNLAVGDKASKATMRIMKENNNGTARILDNNERNKIIDKDVDKDIEVLVEQIDNLNLPDPDFVKIDVEGYETYVINGMLKTLSHSKALLWIEVSEENAGELYEIMATLGYGVEDYNLQRDNNILFSKEAMIKNPYNQNVFQALLKESAIHRENGYLLKREKSKFIYEQKKAENLKELLEMEKSKFDYEQLVAKKRSGEINQCKREIKQYREEIKQYEAKVKKYQDELNIAKEYKDKYTELNDKVILYSKSKLFRLMLLKWKWSTNRRFKQKKLMYTFANWLYVKVMPYPRIRLVCSRINGKLGIIKDPQKVVTYNVNRKSNPVGSASANKKRKISSDLNVAMIVDEFTYNSFKYECNLFPLEPQNWYKVFSENDIDLFFCESAWAGVDTKKHPWRGQVYSSINFPRENRTVLLEILDYCKKNKIPTIFWNKEDPTHYTDKIHNFVDTAIKFDHIFTTDQGCVEKYKTEYGHKSVHCLMFATQPRLFNPIETRKRTDEIIFAGSWYNQHQRRCKEMGDILDNIIQNDYLLKIYDRHSETTDPNHIFPKRFEKYLHPCLKHDQMEEAYKGSKYALNINTVTDSDTMFARRVFELMSSNTFVLSNYSKGMEELFGDNVLFVDGEHDICFENIEDKRETCLYNVLWNHTYQARWEQILQDIGFPYEKQRQGVTLLYYVSDSISSDKAIKHYANMNWKNKKAILYVDQRAESAELRLILETYQNKEITVISEKYCREYEDVLRVQSDYFVWTDESLQSDFLYRAVIHYTYLDKNIGVTQGDKKYSFIERTNINNTLYAAEMFEKVKKGFYEGNFEEKVYYI